MKNQMEFLYIYITWSYIAGAALLLLAISQAIFSEEESSSGLSKIGLLGFGFILFLLSPLTAWHGVLHYAALVWSKVTKQPFKPWI